MSDQHVVFAVLDTVGMPRVPVSRPMSWNEATDRWYALDNRRTGLQDTPQEVITVGLPRDRYPDVPVRFLAVRGVDDPAWPAQDASYPRLRGLTRGAGGRFV